MWVAVLGEVTMAPGVKTGLIARTDFPFDINGGGQADEALTTF
jgi:hypothetical protein